MRGGKADSGCAGKSGFKSTNAVRVYDTSIDPASRMLNSRSGGTREDGAGQWPDNKGRTTVRAGPPTSAFHITELQRTADSGVPQEIVEQPRSDAATVGQEKSRNTQPEVVVTGPLPDVSPVEWPHGTPTTPVLRAEISHPQGPSTPVSSIDCRMTPAQWDRSAGARTGRDRGGSISSMAEASFHKNDRK
jgi:hypothetical protein